MKYAICYSSVTGNTKELAQALKETLPQEECVYVGIPDQQALQADRIFVGFWTDRGSCDHDTGEFLQTVKKKEVFLFGTAGFGGSTDYYEKILGNVKKKLEESNTLIGTYMCQGKMPISVRQRYEKMIQEPNHAPNLEEMICNFDKALSHPNEEDLKKLIESVDRI